MSGSLNIYPFQDTETTIRFVVQITLFLVGLLITNQFIIKPALKLQFERKKRTSGNQVVAQNKLKIAENLELTYTTKFKQSLEEIRALQDAQIKQAKETAGQILVNAQQKSAQYMEEVKLNLSTEKQKASSQIHLHVNSIVNDIYSKLGISAS